VPQADDWKVKVCTYHVVIYGAARANYDNIQWEDLLYAEAMYKEARGGTLEMVASFDRQKWKGDHRTVLHDQFGNCTISFFAFGSDWRKALEGARRRLVVESKVETTGFKLIQSLGVPPPPPPIREVDWEYIKSSKDGCKDKAAGGASVELAAAPEPLAAVASVEPAAPQDSAAEPPLSGEAIGTEPAAAAPQPSADDEAAGTKRKADDELPQPGPSKEPRFAQEPSAAGAADPKRRAPLRSFAAGTMRRAYEDKMARKAYEAQGAELAELKTKLASKDTQIADWTAKHDALLTTNREEHAASNLQLAHLGDLHKKQRTDYEAKTKQLEALLVAKDKRFDAQLDASNAQQAHLGEIHKEQRTDNERQAKELERQKKSLAKRNEELMASRADVRELTKELRKYLERARFSSL
jgi:hypothetical protein